MNENKVQQELKEWVGELSVESTKNLEITLSVIIPISEVAASNPFNLCNLPISSLRFSKKGVSEEVALGLFEAIMWKTGAREFSMEDDRITLTSTGIKLLKYVEQEVFEKLDTEGKKEENDHIITPVTSVEISRIDVLEDKTERKGITIYININYEKPETFSRKKNWGAMYELAKEKCIKYDKDILDYFNSNKKNPLYSRLGFKITKILKQESDEIVPNIEIKIITQNKITRSKLKSA